MVLVYEGVVAQVLDYDYAPSSDLVEMRRKYFNVSQEGKSDVDFLREEELVNGLKLSSKDYQPVTCFQISEKGEELVKKLGKADKEAVHEQAERLRSAAHTHRLDRTRLCNRGGLGSQSLVPDAKKARLRGMRGAASVR